MFCLFINPKPIIFPTGQLDKLSVHSKLYLVKALKKILFGICPLRWDVHSGNYLPLPGETKIKYGENCFIIFNENRS